jgi:hypothetical protein
MPFVQIIASKSLLSISKGCLDGERNDKSRGSNPDDMRPTNREYYQGMIRSEGVLEMAINALVLEVQELLTYDANNDGVIVGADSLDVINNYYNGDRRYAASFFRRSPSVFDIVCYTGTGNNPLVLNHNLGVPPELIIIKKRVAIGSVTNWYCGVNFTASTYTEILLNADGGGALYNYPNWFVSAPTATTFDLNGGGNVNSSGAATVAYLFATCAGVSKVGSYTGTGALQTINCGFTSGARFILIKRTDSTGDWYMYDSARGISASSDPYLLLNTTGTSELGTNYVDTDSTGFKVTAAAPAALNANGGSFIFLAIA